MPSQFVVAHVTTSDDLFSRVFWVGTAGDAVHDLVPMEIQLVLSPARACVSTAPVRPDPSPPSRRRPAHRRRACRARPWRSPLHPTVPVEPSSLDHALGQCGARSSLSSEPRREQTKKQPRPALSTLDRRRCNERTPPKRGGRGGSSVRDGCADQAQALATASRCARHTHALSVSRPPRSRKASSLSASSSSTVRTVVVIIG